MNNLLINILLFSSTLISFSCLILLIKKNSGNNEFKSLEQHMIEVRTRLQVQQTELSNFQQQFNRLLQAQQQELHQQRTQFDQYQQKSMHTLQQGFTQSMREIRQQMLSTLEQHTTTLNKNISALTQATQQHLQQISEQVEKRLTQGFEKTTQTFQDIIKRLTIIDQAQQKITELSSNVVSLQEILADKRSRGAFGEIQLTHLIGNLLPNSCYALQHSLSNQKRVDCMLFLPKPTGHIAIDAKFPLESYQRLIQTPAQDANHRSLLSQFKTDIKKHIKDIAKKYIIPGETADGAIMFIPAEAIFAEIHAHHPDLVSLGQQNNVWLASPTTMMAILTTARAALKDAQTREQVHLIQHHLVHLSKDFGRFKTRMQQLARHINQAHQDIEQVSRSSNQISDRFQKIEQVELGDLDEPDTEGLIATGAVSLQPEDD